MKIKQLCKDVEGKDIEGLEIRPFKDVEITQVTANSKNVGPGALFIAKKGSVFDGANFILEACANGAVAIATDVYDPTLVHVVQLIYSDLHVLETLLATRYYEMPSEDLWMVGITGTCGKTTISYVIQHLLESANEPCGLIGSIEYMVGKKHYNATRTTPDLSSNQKLLREMAREGCKSCVMEVTSHALDQKRVSGIEFDVAVFTNLTHEHFDYHKTMQEYFLAKSMLFQNLKNHKESKKKDSVKVALINADDLQKEKVIQATHPEAHIVTYGIEKVADIQASYIQSTLKETTFTVSYKGKEAQFRWPLIGAFNVSNALAAIGVGLLRGLSLEDLSHHLKTCKPIPGRLEPIENRLGIHIFVDFAHKPQALNNVLALLKELAPKRLIVVFGCGGSRDREKRPMMGKIAYELADSVIVTSDNPRSEDPQRICSEIVAGMPSKKKVEVQVDRKLAIASAIEKAGSGDVVLIAGRGHETKQLFAHLFVDFDDRKIARHYADEVYHKKVLQMAGC